MKIGFLHSVRLHLGNIGNAKMYRIMYEDWKADPDYWLDTTYGQFTNRSKLRGLIYDYRAYHNEFRDIAEYDLIAISLNFDTYPDDFRKFVTAVINDLYAMFPFLKQKEVIILAGNEVFEKRGSVEKVVQTTWDTAQGIKNSVKPDLPICCWNEKIYTSDEKKAFNDLLNNSIIQSICKYVGFQSLGTKACDLATYIRYAKNLGYEPIDVELGHVSDKFSVIRELFDIDKNNQIDKVFILTPKITKLLADYDDMFGNYGLKIGDKEKDKFKIIDYVQQFKTFTNNEQEEIMNKMLDDIIFNRLYKLNSTGKGVERIQRILNLWVTKEYPTEEDAYVYVNGKYDEDTKFAVGEFQLENGLVVDGMAGKQTMTELLKFLLDRVEYYK